VLKTRGQAPTSRNLRLFHQRPSLPRRKLLLLLLNPLQVRPSFADGLVSLLSQRCFIFVVDGDHATAKAAEVPAAPTPAPSNTTVDPTPASEEVKVQAPAPAPAVTKVAEDTSIGELLPFLAFFFVLCFLSVNVASVCRCADKNVLKSKFGSKKKKKKDDDDEL